MTAMAQYGKYRKITYKEGMNDVRHKVFQKLDSVFKLNNSWLGHKEDKADLHVLQLVLRLAVPAEWEKLSQRKIVEKIETKHVHCV